MALVEIQSQLERADGSAVLRNARLPAAMAPRGLQSVGDGLVAADLWLVRGRIEAVTLRGRPGDQRPEIDMAEAMIWAMPIDCHTHVDKGQTWGRTKNPDGSFQGAVATGEKESLSHFDAEDLRIRTAFILDCAVAHGTAAIRSHVDAGQHKFDASFAVLSELAEDYRDRLHIQLAPFTGVSEDPEFVTHLAEVARDISSGVLSAFVYSDPSLDPFLDLMFKLAQSNGLELDFHADELLNADSHCLRAVAKAALRHNFDAPILVGHACALSVQDPDTVSRTLDLVSEAGIAIVALPLCNAYLQDRQTGSPRQRGIAPLHEIAARGIPVAIASDNVRDPFHAYGDMNMPELYRQATHLMHLDHPVGNWPATVSTTAGALIGRPDLGKLDAGRPANMIIFPARNWSEFCARPTDARVLLRHGKVHSSSPPDFSRLDRLKDMEI